MARRQTVGLRLEQAWENIVDPVVHFEPPYDEPGLDHHVLQIGFRVETAKARSLGPEMGNSVVATTASEDVKKGAPASAIGGGFYPRKKD